MSGTGSSEQDEILSGLIGQIQHSFLTHAPDAVSNETIIGGVYAGDIEVVRRAVEIDPSCAMVRSSCGAYPIHLACLLGHLTIVEFGISVAIRCAICETHDGILPLHVAAYAGHQSICEVLVEADISVSAKLTSSGHRPEDAARVSGHTALAEWLHSIRSEYENTLQSNGTAVNLVQRDDPLLPVHVHTEFATNEETKNEDNPSSTEQTQSYLIAEFQRASLLEDEAYHHVHDNRPVDGMTESIMFNVSEEQVGSVAPGGYNQLGQRPFTTNTTSKRPPGSQLHVPPALPVSLEPPVQISSFLYKPVTQKVTPRTRSFTTKNAYSPRRLGTASKERDRPNDEKLELYSGFDEAMVEPQSVSGTPQMAQETTIPGLVVTSASGFQQSSINLNRPSNTMYGGSPNAVHRTVKQIASPYASPRSPSAIHDAHSARNPASRAPAQHNNTFALSEMSVESAALHNPHNYAAYPVSFYSTQPDPLQHIDTSPEDALVREIVTPRAAPVPHSHTQQHRNNHNQTSNAIWASSQQPVYSLRKPIRPASSRASKRSPNGSLCEGSKSNKSVGGGKGTNNTPAGSSASVTLAHRTVVTHRSAETEDNKGEEIAATGVLQSRPLHGIHDLKQHHFYVPTSPSTIKSPAIAKKEKIIIPRLNIGDAVASAGKTSEKDPNKLTPTSAKQEEITFSRGVPVSANNIHGMKKKGFAPSPVLRATHNFDLLLSPAYKQRINLSQMVHTVERIVSDPQYSPPVQPLPLLSNNNTSVHNNPLNAHYSQLPRNERYDIYVDFSQSQGGTNGKLINRNKVFAHSVVMPSVTVDTNFDTNYEGNDTRSAEDCPG